MRWLTNRLKPELFFRLGLTGVLISTGWLFLTAPVAQLSLLDQWPAWLLGIVNSVEAETWLQLMGAFQLAIGVLFLLWFMPSRVIRWATIVTTIYFIALFYLTGLGPETNYYWGLIGLSLGTWAIYRRRL